MATKGYLMLLGGMREIERILKERMHEDEETIEENGVCVLVESMADQIDELKGELKTLEAKAEAGEPVAWMRYLQGDVFQCDKDRDDAFPVYARPVPADGALREVLDKIADIVNRRLAEPGDKDETETLFRIGTVVDAYLSPPSSWPTNETESEAAHMNGPAQDGRPFEAKDFKEELGRWKQNRWFWEVIDDLLSERTPPPALCEICGKPEDHFAHNQDGHNFQPPASAGTEGPGLRDVVRKEIDGLMDNARHDCATNRAVAVDRIMAALRPSPSNPSLREVGWLIEAPGPQWWDGFWFCTDSMDAVRFSRKLDAEKVIRETVEQVPTIQPIEFLAVEHAWSDVALARTPPQKPAETPASPEVEARREIARRFSGPEGDAAAEETKRALAPNEQVQVRVEPHGPAPADALREWFSTFKGMCEQIFGVKDGKINWPQYHCQAQYVYESMNAALRESAKERT